MRLIEKNKLYILIMKLLLDNNLSPRLVKAFLEKGLEADHVLSLSLELAPDEEI